MLHDKLTTNSLRLMLGVTEKMAKKLNLSDYHSTPLPTTELDGRRVEFAVVTGTLSPKLEVIKIVRKKQP